MLPLKERTAPHVTIDQWRREDLLAEVYRLRDQIAEARVSRNKAQHEAFAKGRRVEELERRLSAMGDDTNAAGQRHKLVGKRTSRDLAAAKKAQETAERLSRENTELRRLVRVYVPADERAKAGL